MFFCSLLFAAEESISITTYYPSPYGVYNELRLFPHSSPVAVCGPETEGTMYYDIDDHELKVCDGIDFGSKSGFWAASGNDIYSTNTGNVGIGTTAPSGHLTIYGDAEIKLESDNNPANYADIHFDNTKAGGREFVVGNYGSAASPKNTFFIRDQTEKENRFIINKDGNVGIGEIDDPRTLLHLKRKDEIDLWIEGKSPDIKFVHSKAKYDTWRIGLDDDNGNLRVSLNEKTTSDPDKTVKDNLLVITSDGDVIAKGGSWMASDRAYKKDIDYNFQYGLKAIEQLKPAYYNLKDDETNKKQIGFIAQDVKEVIPELVSGDEGTYSLAYAQFVPVLVNAVKEQQKQIIEQQKQIDDLKAQINELKPK